MTIFEYLKFDGDASAAPQPLKMRCPHCSVIGVFQARKEFFWVTHSPKGGWQNAAGPRFCTNSDCGKLVFFVSRGQTVLLSYPPEVLDFDSTSVPEAIQSAMREAIQCHAAGCYRAAALMVRRTLEEICLERGAEGRDLSIKIKALGDIVTLPKELLDSLHQLRVLGNDAAHIEARVYEGIGKEELEVAILLAKEILKSTYQYADLLSRLKALGRPEV